MPRLLWLDINCSYVHSSLALPYIHAQRKNENTEWLKLSATISANIGETVAKAVKLRPDIIAATLWLFNHEYTMAVLKRIKTVLPECTVILGGPEFLGCNKEFLSKNPEVDCVFRGEGDTEFHNWLEVYNTKDKWKGIDGICLLDNSIYYDNGLAKVEDFFKLNPPETSKFFEWSKPFVQLETSRGCFNSCTFCVSGNDKPVRTIPVENIRKRIENIYAKGIREIRFLDRTFNGNSRRALEILDLLGEFPDMRFHLEIHPGLLNDELREKLIIIPDNTLHLEAGIQSLDDMVLKTCKRIGNTDKALDGLKFLCGLGNIITHVDLIAGLPYYTFNNLKNDIITLAEYGAKEIQLELLKLLPGTEMRKRAMEWEIKYSPLPPYEILSSNSMTIEDLQKARLVSKLIDKYYNTRAWQNFFRKMMLGNKEFLSQFLEWLSCAEYLDQSLSIEKRGMLLFDFICRYYPDKSEEFIKVWTDYGLSVRKLLGNKI
ncbi:MAG: B12-binding domain-containing radical SAM protein [Rikenellaceae bacterium]|nr:B12-binding domain-containing radical SAM protein [Rikenellaceae bacterium]